jgi:phosphate transport system substrate-binding protein
MLQVFPVRMLPRVGRRLGIHVMWAIMAATALAQAEDLKLGGTGGSLSTMRLLAEAFAKANPDITLTIVPSLGSTGGIEAVLKGALPLAVSARELKDSERAHGAREVEYGRAAFAFVTSSRNVTSLTLREVADIYSGKTDKWPDGSRIRLVLRPLGDSDSHLIKSISPEMQYSLALAEARPGMLFAVNDHDNADDLEKLPGSFGAATVPQLVSEKRSLRVLRLNGVEPSARTLADGSYPYYKRLYLVTGPKSPPSAGKFITFVRSPAGRRVLERTGHWIVE